MGDYGNDVTSSQAAGLTYHGYKKHCSMTRQNTHLEITEALRQSYPSCNITAVKTRSCDLVAFAHAGHATAKLKTEGNNFVSERTYDPPASRIEGGSGNLGDRVQFGLYDYEWQGQAFEFYVAFWMEKSMGSQKYCYVLSPQAAADAEGHNATVDELLMVAGKWTSQLHEEIYVYDDGYWGKNKKLWAAVQKSHWEDAILDPAMKETLIGDVHNFFDSRELYEEYAVPWKRGIIFHGTPGCGKTISIKALMNTLDKRDQPVASLYVKTLANCRGLHYSIREIFEQARVMAPCLLVFEDLDSLVVDKVRSYFLNEVDGLEDNNGILMIGSTNHLERLDPGISKRPSRFDRKYHFKIPGERERILYCEYWKKKLEKNSNIDFDPAISDVVAKLTDGYSFAYMKELFVQTLLTIVGGRASEVDEAEMEETAEAAKVTPGSARLTVGNGSVESTAEDTEGNKEDEKTSERQMPTVDIPDSIKDNALMKVLHKQAIALWKDMDSSNDEEAGKKKVADKADDGESDSD